MNTIMKVRIKCCENVLLFLAWIESDLCLIVVIGTLSCRLNAELAKLWWPAAIVQGVTSNQGTGNLPDKQNM